MCIYLCGFKRKVIISDIVKIVPVTISTRLHDLTYYDCMLTNGKSVRINVEDGFSLSF